MDEPVKPLTTLTPRFWAALAVSFICSMAHLCWPLASPARFFGAVAEWIRANVHQPGGSIPSPHCAVATVMWFMSLKYTRRGFVWLAPIILSLYASTVYGRFHYLSDMIIGVATGLLVLLGAPAIARAWDRRLAAGGRALL